jgi:predicted nucleic acid-binding protein
MNLIVDASVAVKWFAPEPGSDRARMLGGAQNSLMAPDIVVAEVGNALWKKCARRLFAPEEAIAAMHSLPMLFQELHAILGLAPRAIAIATALNHPIYDCFYLALAERERAPLVTADSKLLEAAARLGTVEAQALSG